MFQLLPTLSWINHWDSLAEKLKTSALFRSSQGTHLSCAKA